MTVREPFPELERSLSKKGSILSMLRPIALVVFSNIVHQIRAKEVPKDMDAIASMSITCLVGLFFLNR